MKFEFDKNFNIDEIDYLIGDFSFIKNKNCKESLIYDYNLINKLNGWEYLKNNYDKTFWNKLNFLFYPKHTQETFKNNINHLEFIAQNNWTEFVIHYFNELS